MSPMKNNVNSDKVPPSIDAVLAHLADDGQTLLHRQLAWLSDMDASAMQKFSNTWHTINRDRQRRIVTLLVELSEDNIEFSFTGIFKYLLTDPDDMVRKEAIEGLWENDEPSLIRQLLKLLTEDSATSVREAAARALGRFALMAEHQKIGAEYRSQLAQALLKVFNTPSEEVDVRRRALESAAPLSRPEITQAIWTAYRQADLRLKASAIYAMGKNCDLLWLPTIIQELSSDVSELRYEAVEAAGEIGEQEAVPRLIEMLKDPDRDIRIATIVALGKIGGDDAKKALHECLSSKSQSIKDAAEQALSEIELFEEPLSPHEID
jgi:HEAT repeat protein